jgi:CheY-like chemotaxis protein
VEAADGPAALQLWQEQHTAIDLLYTDAVMPGGLSGLELASRLRGDKPGLKVIVSSGYSAELVQQDRSALADVTFISKPCAPANLATAVRACLDRPGTSPLLGARIT